MTAPRSLARGLRVLELAAAHPAGLGHGELVAELALPGVTVSRLLAALCELGYLERQSADGRYRPGPQLGALGAQEPNEARLRRRAGPLCAGLRERCGNTVLLLQWTGTHAICLERYLHADSIVMQEPGYVTAGLHASPYGIFFLSPARWERALRGPRREGVSRRRYRAETSRLQRHGFCCGHTIDKQRLAAALRDGERVIGAIAIGGTRQSLPDRRVGAIGRMLAEATARF